MKGRGRLGVSLLALLCAAPTPGDIGSCGQAVVELDEQRFFFEKLRIDCNQCAQCGLSTQRCVDACAVPLELDLYRFEEGCFPLVHDGEVCLNALLDADCDEYAPYVDDTAPTTPTECNFCPLAERPAP